VGKRICGDTNMVKAYLYTIELMITLSIVFLIITFVFNAPSFRPDFGKNVIKKSIINSAEYMYYNDELRKFMENNNESLVEARIIQMVPDTITIEVSDNCDTANLPQFLDVYRVKYYIAGYQERYFFKRICISGWEQ